MTRVSPVKWIKALLKPLSQTPQAIFLVRKGVYNFRNGWLPAVSTFFIADLTNIMTDWMINLLTVDYKFSGPISGASSGPQWRVRTTETLMLWMGLRPSNCMVFWVSAKTFIIQWHQHECRRTCGSEQSTSCPSNRVEGREGLHL